MMKRVSLKRKTKRQRSVPRLTIAARVKELIRTEPSLREVQRALPLLAGDATRMHYDYYHTKPSLRDFFLCVTETKETYEFCKIRWESLSDAGVFYVDMRDPKRSFQRDYANETTIVLENFEGWHHLPEAMATFETLTAREDHVRFAGVSVCVSDVYVTCKTHPVKWWISETHDFPKVITKMFTTIYTRLPSRPQVLFETREGHDFGCIERDTSGKLWNEFCHEYT